MVRSTPALHHRRFRARHAANRSSKDRADGLIIQSQAVERLQLDRVGEQVVKVCGKKECFAFERRA